MSAVLVTKGISKTYGNEKVKVRALRSCSMAIEKGEFVAIVGKSGSGKSTLLRILGTLEPPDEGQVFLEGKELSGLSDKKLSRLRRRRIGFVYQDYSLFPEFTAYENIAMPFHLDGRKENKNYIKELMNTLGIYQCRDKFPSEMSGGEQQRVALARALATEPDFLLLDEPLSALDAKVRLTLRREICKIQRELNLTTIMVTHDQDEALTMADRIVVMNKAVIMQSGTPEQIYENPENPFVADFIGSINFINAKEGAPYGLVKGETAAIRPEKIQITRSEQEGSLKGTIQDIEFRGFYNRVTVGLSHVVHGDIALAVDVPFQTAKTMRFRTGENVYLVIPREEVLQFETA